MNQLPQNSAWLGMQAQQPPQQVDPRMQEMLMQQQQMPMVVADNSDPTKIERAAGSIRNMFNTPAIPPEVIPMPTPQAKEHYEGFSKSVEEAARRKQRN